MDIRAGLEAGVLTPDTEILGFERNREKAALAEAVLRSMRFHNFRISRHDVCKSVSWRLVSHNTDGPWGRPFDLVNLDLCGTFCPGVGHFLRNTFCEEQMPEVVAATFYVGNRSPIPLQDIPRTEWLKRGGFRIGAFITELGLQLNESWVKEARIRADWMAEEFCEALGIASKNIRVFAIYNEPRPVAVPMLYIQAERVSFGRL